MKIKVIEVSSDTNIGGAGKCLITLLENFDRSQFDVKAVLPKNSLLKPHIEKLGTKVIEVDGISDKSLDFKAIMKLKRIFKQEKPDIVHTHASMSARIAAKLAGVKIVYTRHSVFPPSRKLSQGMGKVINGFVNNSLADGIIAVAEAAKDNLTDTGIDEKKITVILNGVDGLTRVQPAEAALIRKRFNVADNEKVISIVARLEDIKGHEYLIEAAKDIIKTNPNVKIFIAGTGSYESTLKAKVQELNLQDTVIFTGFISDVDKLMNITDIQVNASYGTEATSLALLEGMSIGIPAVVSDFGGNPGVIKDGANGLVVPKKNPVALAEGIKKLLSDNVLYRKMSGNAVKMFNETFTASVMTKNTENLYKKIMNR